MCKRGARAEATEAAAEAAAEAEAACRWFGVSSWLSYVPDAASECGAGTLPPGPSHRGPAERAAGEGGARGDKGDDADGGEGEAKHTLPMPLPGVRREPGWAARLVRGAPAGWGLRLARGRKLSKPVGAGRSAALMPSAT